MHMQEGKRGMGRVRDVGTEVQRTTSAPRVWRYRIFSSEVAAEQVNRHLTIPQRWVFMTMGAVPRSTVIITTGGGRTNALVAPLVGDVHQTNA